MALVRAAMERFARSFQYFAVGLLLGAFLPPQANSDDYEIPGSAAEAELRGSRIYTTDQLQSAQLARLPDDAFSGLSDYSLDPDAEAILVNCRAWAGVESIKLSRIDCFLADPDHRLIGLRE
ncbi:MAG: hypothetical protein R3176_09870 [Woeseiaceae bacterium]|nr:hypothetical protein [Woeseiaceae bacterium]